MVFKNIPLQIPFKDELIIRGEALISFEHFNIINENLSIEEKYKNPRNLCSYTYNNRRRFHKFYG